MKESEENYNPKGMGHGRVKRIKRTWDFLCVSSDGKILHFSKISRKVSIAAFACSIIIVFSSVLSYFFVNQRKELVMLTAKFISMETRLQDVSRERDEFAAKIALVEKSAIAKSDKSKDKDQGSDQKTKVSEEQEQKSVPMAVVNDSSLILDGSSAKRSKGSSLVLRLHLKSTLGEQAQVKGYIYSALMPSSDSDPSKWKLNPGVNLKDGVPEAPDKGQYFSIKGEKEITLKLKSSDSFKAVKVFIFDDKGKSLAQNVFQIEEAPRKEKKKSRRK